MKQAISLIALGVLAVLVFTGCPLLPGVGPEPPSKSSEKSILSLSFLTPPSTGSINEADHTIAVSVPSATTVASLIPTITVSPKAAVSPASGIAQDFTNSVSYTVTAEDGSTQAYVVTVTVQPKVGPQNNDRIDAIRITLGTTEVTVTGTVLEATHDAPATGGATGADVWYVFTVPEAGPVYFDTTGSQFDTFLVITDAAGNPVGAQPANMQPNAGLFNDDMNSPFGDFTTGLESWTWGYFTPGEYYIAIGRYSDVGMITGDFTLHAQYMRSSTASVFSANGVWNEGSVNGVLTGSSAQASSLGTAASGESAYWFTTAGRTQFFSTCRGDSTAAYSAGWSRGNSNPATMPTYDPIFYIQSAKTGLEEVVNDDADGGIDAIGYTTDLSTVLAGDTYRWGSRLGDTNMPRGLNVLFVDSRFSSGMTFYVRYLVQ